MNGGQSRVTGAMRKVNIIVCLIIDIGLFSCCYFSYVLLLVSLLHVSVFEQLFIVLMLAVRCSMCILRISVICNLCNVTAIFSVPKQTSTSIHTYSSPEATTS